MRGSREAMRWQERGGSRRPPSRAAGLPIWAGAGGRPDLASDPPGSVPELVAWRDGTADRRGSAEEPRIAACYDLAQVKNLVVVPFFISDGLHSAEDIPILLGERESAVRERIENGQPGWRNPTEKRGKRVWYARGVGTEPRAWFSPRWCGSMAAGF